ncbi:hypothetical protein [uncultured Deinococcus sp.]|uniref:hypothetical protein n=1 Tax=uncultured Deinococcus sp. TaxID=158789 RepID=UPI0037480DB9
MALVGIVMAAVLTLNLRTGNATSALQVRSDLTSETQIAQNYIAGKLRNAVYIYPYQRDAVVSVFSLASSGYSTFNPNSSPTERAGFNGTGNYNWRFGSGDGNDPFIAFIVPPQSTANSIDVGDCAAATTDTARAQSCYAFYAYYAVPRSLLVSGGGSGSGSIPTGANRLTADPANDANVWALMEYRSYFTGSGYSVSTSSGFTTGGTGRLVLDYVRPTSQNGADKLFVGEVGTAIAPVKSVTINLAARRQAGGQTVNIPTADRYSLTIYPRNIGAPIISN